LNGERGGSVLPVQLDGRDRRQREHRLFAVRADRDAETAVVQLVADPAGSANYFVAPFLEIRSKA
jgi:hypothetical protein